MKSIYIDVPAPNTMPIRKKKFCYIKAMILSPLYWLLSHKFDMPGLKFYWECIKLGVFLLFRREKSSLSYISIYNLLFFPMDSTRYFEFDFVWQTLSISPVCNYLDISSPRIIPLLFLHKHPKIKAELINPDENDYEITANFVDALDLNKRCNLKKLFINEVSFNSSSFDIITCVSVLEHIPGNDGVVGKMWDLLRPGGKLIITLPCMAVAAEQYISESEYGLLSPGSDGYTFWQLYYDALLLEEKIFNIIGKPVRMSVYGEKKDGLFAKNAHLKRLGEGYPFWREPYMMGKEYDYFSSINDLPGEGVVAMEFVK